MNIIVQGCGVITDMQDAFRASIDLVTRWIVIYVLRRLDVFTATLLLNSSVLGYFILCYLIWGCVV